MAAGAQSERVQSERVNVVGALRDAAFTGVVAFGLFLPLIGFQTDVNGSNELILTTRWPLLFAFVAITAAGRFVYSFALAPWLARRAQQPAQAAPAALARIHLAKWFVPFAIGFVIVYPLIILVTVGLGGALKWIDNFGIQILIYVMLGWGLNIVVGLAGLLDLGYVAFYAVGAYSYALLAKTFGLSFWILLPLAGILSSFWGILLGFPVLRLRGDYLAIVTLAFGEIIRLILINWVDADQRLCRHQRHSAAELLRHSVQRRRQRLCRHLRARILADLSRHLSLLPHPGAGAAHLLRHRAAAPAADRPRLGSAARGRDRLPLARHQHHQYQAHRLRHGRDVRRLRRLVLRRARKASSRRNPSPSSNRRPSCRSWCSAAWAARSASPSPPS